MVALKIVSSIPGNEAPAYELIELGANTTCLQVCAVEREGVSDQRLHNERTHFIYGLLGRPSALMKALSILVNLLLRILSADSLSKVRTL